MPMTRFGWLVVSTIIIAALGIALLLWGFSRQSSERVEDMANRTAVVDPETLAIYTNGVYGFSFFYPASATVTDSFMEGSSFLWRGGATATGTPIMRIALADGEVRIGASEQEAARSACVRASPSEQTLEPLSVGTTTWQVFSSELLGTEQERRIISYRTLHEDRCFAVETFETVVRGSELSTAEELEFIVRNFTFAR